MARATSPPGVQQGTDGPCGVAGNNRIFMACRRGPVKFVRSVGSVFSGLVRRSGTSRKMHAADAIEQRVRCSATCPAIPGGRSFSSTYGALFSPLEPNAYTRGHTPERTSRTLHGLVASCWGCMSGTILVCDLFSCNCMMLLRQRCTAEYDHRKVEVAAGQGL